METTVRLSSGPGRRFLIRPTREVVSHERFPLPTISCASLLFRSYKIWEMSRGVPQRPYLSPSCNPQNAPISFPVLKCFRTTESHKSREYTLQARCSICRVLFQLNSSHWSCGFRCSVALRMS